MTRPPIRLAILFMAAAAALTACQHNAGPRRGEPTLFTASTTWQRVRMTVDIRPTIVGAPCPARVTLTNMRAGEIGFYLFPNNYPALILQVRDTQGNIIPLTQDGEAAQPETGTERPVRVESAVERQFDYDLAKIFALNEPGVYYLNVNWPVVALLDEDYSIGLQLQHVPFTIEPPAPAKAKDRK